MDEATVVNLAYVLTYGLIIWYAARLYFREHRLTRQLQRVSRG
jgi:membrane protein CcdC involved in cytochrome C biogenesis